MSDTPGASSSEPLAAHVQAATLPPTTNQTVASALTSTSPLYSQGTDMKITSPRPMSASASPPPSSQPRASRQSLARTPTPQTPHLSSPPPTIKQSAHLETVATATDHGMPSTERVANANIDELRNIVNELCVALRDSRLAAAHHKLQYSMLSMESQEVQNRMAVELDMAQREVEVYQEAESRRRLESADATLRDEGAANATLLHEMSRHCSLLQQDNEELQDRLAQTQQTLEARDSTIGSLLEKNEQLRERIRKNREHMNGFIDYVHEHSPQSLVGTPQHQTPRARTQVGPMSVPGSAQRAAFEDLLLADQVLSARYPEPTTPTRGKRLGHRAVQSLSSLPSTPQRLRPGTANTNFQTPPLLRTIHEPPRTVPAVMYASHRRQPSSDSTVTASSVDEDVPESRASQAATSMLRRTPKSGGPSKDNSFNSQAGGTASQGKLKQTKLFGQISKPGVQSAGADQYKRKLSEQYHNPAAMHSSPPKKARTGGMVGLGIGVDRRM